MCIGNFTLYSLLRVLCAHDVFNGLFGDERRACCHGYEKSDIARYVYQSGFLRQLQSLLMPLSEKGQQRNVNI